MAIEVFLIAFVLSAGHYLWQEQLAIRADTWYAIQTPQGLALSLAGKCYAWFSLPVFQFILIRWYYRLLLWGQFLWRVSRLDLDLRPAHPDRAGGLGFLGTSTYAFAPLLLGQSVIVSAMIAGRILHEGAQLPAFKYELAGALVLALLQALGPLLVFVPGLLAAKRRGLREYGLLADRYVREFDRKWLHGGAAPDEALVGTGDIQSLADLGNSFAVVSGDARGSVRQADGPPAPGRDRIAAAPPRADRVPARRADPPRAGGAPLSGVGGYLAPALTAFIASVRRARFSATSL